MVATTTMMVVVVLEEEEGFSSKPTKDASDDDKNPEWEEIFKDSPGLMNKMEEFSGLQREGADVFMGSFSMLKLFPFFNEISNWFIPFFIENPEISGSIDESDEVNQRFLTISFL